MVEEGKNSPKMREEHHTRDQSQAGSDFDWTMAEGSDFSAQRTAQQVAFLQEICIQRDGTIHAVGHLHENADSYRSSQDQRQLSSTGQPISL